MPLEVVPLRLRERGWLVGPPEEISLQLREWEAAGVQRVMLQCWDLDDMEGLALLAEVARGVRA